MGCGCSKKGQRSEEQLVQVVTTRKSERRGSGGSKASKRSSLSGTLAHGRMARVRGSSGFQAGERTKQAARPKVTFAVTATIQLMEEQDEQDDVDFAVDVMLHPKHLDGQETLRCDLQVDVSHPCCPDENDQGYEALCKVV